MKSIDNIKLNRRQLLALGLGTGSAFMLAACGGSNDQAAQNAAATEEPEGAKDEQEAPEIDKDAFDALLAKGPVAENADVSASAWAKKVKKAGTLRVGGVKTSTFFSLLDMEDNHYRGFDAGLFQLLARYITGDETKFELTEVTSDTRESVLEGDVVDAVFATYSITKERMEKIDFGGPYYTSQQSILVSKDNADIKSLDDLAGKNVAVQSGSTGPTIMEDLCPDAILQEYKTDPEARLALEQGRVEAYVIDNTMQMGAVARNPSKYKIVGDPFGPIDPYGIGLPKQTKGAVDFVNDFLTKIEKDGIWAELWQVSLGDRIGSTDVPEPPALGVFE
ncbi:MAG: glutamate ABC transporter substrate-binding protein [Atopobiaceae bacterium]|nr:glutamate ABC transporter substrate-binding protein [Atopobiaceae bacterium]